MSGGGILGFFLFMVLVWAALIWAARAEIARLERQKDALRAEAARAEALAAAGLERENRQAAANAALRRALDEAEAARAQAGRGTVTVMVVRPMGLLETVTGEKVRN